MKHFLPPADKTKTTKLKVKHFQKRLRDSFFFEKNTEDNVRLRAIWCNLYNLKNVTNTRVLLLAKLQAEAIYQNFQETFIQFVTYSATNKIHGNYKPMKHFLLPANRASRLFCICRKLGTTLW